MLNVPSLFIVDESLWIILVILALKMFITRFVKSERETDEEEKDYNIDKEKEKEKFTQ